MWARYGVSPGIYLATLANRLASDQPWQEVLSVTNVCVHHSDISPDGRWLLAGGTSPETPFGPAGRLQLYSLPERRMITNLTLLEEPVQIHFAPDGRRVVVANFCLWDLDTHRIRIYSVPEMREIGYARDFPVHGVFQLSPDEPDSRIFTANACTAMTLTRRGHIVSTEGEWLTPRWLGARRGQRGPYQVFVNDLTTGELIRKWPAETNLIRCLAVSADGRMAITGQGYAGVENLFVGPICGNSQLGYSNGSPGSFKAWRIDDGALLWEYMFPYVPLIGGEPSGPRDIQISPNGIDMAYTLDGGHLAYVRMPLAVTGFEPEGGAVNLYWAGGGGRYQIQKAERLGGTWETVSTTTNLTFSSAVGGNEGYFRVAEVVEP